MGTSGLYRAGTENLHSGNRGQTTIDSLSCLSVFEPPASVNDP